MKRNALRVERSSDPIWWVLAGALCLSVMWLPHALGFKIDRAGQDVMIQVGLFFAGALLGALRPYRVWRWPVASYLAFGFADLIRTGNSPTFSLSATGELWTHLAQNASVYMLHTLPVLIGAYLGSYLSMEGVH